MDNTYTKYEERLASLRIALKKTQKKLNQTVILRLTIFLLAFLLLWFFWGAAYLAHWVLFVALISFFLFLVRSFEKLKFEKNYLKVLVQINENEKVALNGDFSHFPSGEAFDDPNHPFASDLDLFGANSIFQYLNRSKFYQSKAILANLLKHPHASASKIAAIQQGVEELTPNLAFRQNLHARIHFLSEDEGHAKFLKSWSVKEEDGITNTFIKVITKVLPLAMFVVLLFHIFGSLTFSVAIYLYLIPLLITGYYLKKITEEHGLLGKVTEGLNAFENAIKTIENQQFNAAYLKEKKAPFEEGLKASEAIDQLKKLSGYFDQRSNILVGILFNVFFLWDIQLGLRLEQWKKKYGVKVNVWLAELAELEVMAMLANLNHNRQDLNFPTIHASQNIEAQALGHPLILKDRINNNLSLNTENHVVVLTGANMAGKSTFLRTLGINLILGQIGAPVCAETMHFPVLKLFSGMRTSDSLQEHTSYFFTELKRLSKIVKSLESGEKLFILLDEILKGTNSKDKEEGSKKLIKRLLDLNAGAIVATHDLGLCKLESEFPQRVTNMAFETEIKDNELHFDYKLKKGICQTMNASFLMEKMGITSSQS